MMHSLHIIFVFLTCLTSTTRVSASDRPTQRNPAHGKARMSTQQEAAEAAIARQEAAEAAIAQQVYDASTPVSQILSA
jgi:hypothetical protein